MTATVNYLRSLRVSLVLRRRSLIVLLLDWVLIALVAWVPSASTGDYYAGLKAGGLFVLVIFGIIATVQFVVRVVRHAVRG